MRLHCEFVKKLCVHFRIFFRDCRSIKRKKRARIQSSKLGMCTSAYQFLPLPEYRCCIHERFICLSHVPAIGRCSTNSQPTREKKGLFDENASNICSHSLCKIHFTSSQTPVYYSSRFNRDTNGSLAPRGVDTEQYRGDLWYET